MLNLKLKKKLGSILSLSSERDITQFNFLYQQLLQQCSKDAIWLHSLMKSGTTYTALFLSNYINKLYGDGAFVSFDRMIKEFCIHSFEERIKRENVEVLIADNKIVSGIIPPYKGFYATHISIEEGLWMKNISLYRNPLDYLVSVYHYFYINRGIACKHPRKLIPERIEQFSSVINSQRINQNKYKDRVSISSYERLIRNPELTFTGMIDFLGFEFDQNAFEFSLENSSKKKVLEMENDRGEAIVKKDGIKFKGSFIRSGKIGEWKSFFTDKDLKRIDEELSKYGLGLNEFEIE